MTPPTTKDLWREMLDADQTYLHARARWREIAADEGVGWDDQVVLDATDELEAAGHESNAAHDAFDEGLASITPVGDRLVA